MSKQTIVSKDVANKKILIEREFEGSLERVWQAWTDRSLLDLWWAPKPWKAQTKTMDFKSGGSWLYSMNGPDGEQHWSRADYEKVIPQKSFIGIDCFCDENGQKNDSFPGMHWNVEFLPTGANTTVKVEITFENEADMNKILEMGFEQGFTMAHGNLDELLAKKQQKV